MPPLQFSKAKKSQAKLRLALNGPSGSGKTFTALSVATNLGTKVAVIDTENKSASKYADKFSFDECSLASYSPDTYVEAIKAAAEAGYDVLVIDSLSHAWAGKDGALEQADKATAKGGNKFTAWRSVTPMHNRLVETILSAPLHIICTMRTKTEYTMEEDDRGKKVPKKVGMAPIQRDGVEYEFDVVGDMNQDNDLIVSKTRCSILTGQVLRKPGADLAKILQGWLSDGEPETAKENATAIIGKQVAGHEWLLKIGLCKSIPELEQLGSQLKELPSDIQSAVIGTYKARKAQLQQS